MSEVGAYFICFNLRGSIWYTYSKPLSAERRSLIDWSHRFAPLLWFLNNYCTHISCSQLCVSPMSWWWYTFICTKDSVKNIHCQIEYIGTGMGIGKTNRASWMQKKGVLPKHWRNQPRQLISPMQKKGVYHCLACQCRKNTIGARVGIKGSKVSSFSSVNVCSARHWGEEVVNKLVLK